MFSNRLIAILGVIIILLMLTQFLFTPFIASTKTKYVSAQAKTKGYGTRKKPYRNLQYAINHCDDGDTLIILPGVYKAKTTPFLEDLCGNCQEQRTVVNATRGFLIEGITLTIIGSGADETTLITNAGYGFLFLNSYGSSICNLTITGGKRDIDGNATDAGIVVKFSTVSIINCQIIDNTDRPEEITVGIGGIMGREASQLYILNNQIINNGWDGIALYRGANAFISGNTIRKGRGAGIGITWDATAVIIDNEISDYWKGIGSFGDSRVIARRNIVKDCIGWGIIASGTSYLDACNNIIYHIGNCGLASWSENASGRFSNNIVTLCGWKEEWVSPRAGLQNNGGIENFTISYNNIWNNQEADYGNMPDMTGIEGNISADPLFKHPSLGDFRLQPNSPCIDSGNPNITDADGSISDIGLPANAGVVK